MSTTRGPVARELYAAVAAAAFLTRVPLGRPAIGTDDVRRSGWAFPIIGAGIGAAAGATVVVLRSPLSPTLAAAIAIGLGTLLTGALHLDALADTADALGVHTRERALEVMRDPATGAFGTTAIVVDLLIRTAALAAAAARPGLIAATVAVGAVARAIPVALGATLPYARAGEGTGAALARASTGRAAVASVIAAAVAVGVAGTRGAVIAGGGVLVTLVAAVMCRRRLGGVTGDTLGAALQIGETTGLILAVATGAGR